MRPSNVSVICCVIAGWVTGSAAEKPRFDCKTKEKWSREKAKWCCENEQINCPAPDCSSTKEVWSPKKAKWCCENEQKGCPSPPPPPPQPLYDCSTKEVWSPEKAKWCCENEQINCPPCVDTTKCKKKKCKNYDGKKLQMCKKTCGLCEPLPPLAPPPPPPRPPCKYLWDVNLDDKTDQKHCPPPPPPQPLYDCSTKEVWSPEKAKWCCENEKLPKDLFSKYCSPPPPPPRPPCKYLWDVNLDDKTDQKHCPPPPPPQPLYDCSTKEVWSPEKAKWCCENEQINCPPCVDTTKCKKKKCKDYDAAKLKQCKKTCGLCEPLPPSAPPTPPPPPPALPEDDCSGLKDKKKCKIKMKKCKTKKQLIKCGQKCKKDRKKKKLCQRTCCELGFPV